MKITTYITLAISLVLLFSCQNNKNAIVLKGEISNLDSSEILISYFVSDTLAIDTIFSRKKGKFTYKNTIDTLTVFSLYFNDQRSSVPVFVKPADKIYIKGDAWMPDLIKVNGNEINDDLTFFKESNQNLLNHRAILIANLHSDTVASVRPLNDGINRINAINQELALNAEEYIKGHPTKMSSLILINEFFTDPENPKGLERMMEYMQGNVMKTTTGLSLKAYSDKLNRSAEGASMPYFQLVDKSGDTIQSYDLLGKYVLLSFVSTTGDDSRQAIQTLKEAYRNVNKDSVEFITIYIDSDSHPIEYLERDSIEWTVVPEKKSWASEIVSAYNIEFIPNNILISPAGVIHNRNLPAPAVENALESSTKNNR